MDACVVAVTLVVTMIYTFSDLSGASLIPRCLLNEMFNLLIYSTLLNPHFTPAVCMLRTVPLNFFFFFNQGILISSLPENNNPCEGFQAGVSEERTGEGHQEDGNIITLRRSQRIGECNEKDV